MAYNREMSLKDWQKMFCDIYFPAQNYGRSKFEIFTQLVKTFGAGSHFLFREQDPKKSRDYVAKVFAWYCALATRLGIDLDDALWQKYPLVCPRCLLRKCDCPDPPPQIEPTKLSMVALENSHMRPVSLREWQAMFSQLYKGPNGRADIPHSKERLALVFSRIVEEIGEVAESLRLDPVVDVDADLILKNEMADLGAWVFTLANNLHCVDVTAQSAVLADILWDLFPAKCNRCGESKCICIRGTYAIELAEKGAMAPSHWDDRTGLANDKALKTYLNYASSKFADNDYSWSIIFLDLDDFGAVNKTFCHQVGDEVLREAAKRIESAVGKSGIAFRRGGEEFVVVMHAPFNTAIIIAEQIRRLLEHSYFETETLPAEAKLKVTASLGVASCMNDSQPPNKLEAVAEARAKEAKIAGKNCVVPTPSAELLKLGCLE